MRKKGYTVQVNGNDVIISSTIWMRFQDPSGTLTWANPNNMIAFINYVRTVIHSVWNSDYNRGLQPPFHSSNFAIRTNITINNANILGVPLILREGHCLIDVFPFGGRDFINAGEGFFQKNIQQLVQRLLRSGNFYAAGAFVNVGGVIVYLPNPTNFPDYTYAHEFGHVLGLADRYTSICNYFYDSHANLTSTISNHAPVNFPIFLPCFHEPGEPLPTSNPNVNTVIPQYQQAPYAKTVNTLFNRSAGTLPNPQTNYRATPYDLDYSTRFGWMHNLMSRDFSPNRDGPNNPFPGRVITYDYLYQLSPDLTPAPAAIRTPITAAPPGLPAAGLMTGDATIAVSEKTLIISSRQINIVINKKYFEANKHKKLFEQFKFVKELRQAGPVGTGTDEPISDPTSAPNDPDKFVRQGGSYLGILFKNYSNDYTDNLTKSDLDESTVVSDELFDSLLAFQNPLNTHRFTGSITNFAASLVTPPQIVITTATPHNLNDNDSVSIINLYRTGTPPVLSTANVVNNAIQVTGTNTFELVGTALAIGEIFSYSPESKYTVNMNTIKSLPITAVAIAGPVLTFTANNHGFVTGEFVSIAGVGGIAAANIPSQQITVINPNQFSFNSPGAAGVYVANTGIVNQIKVNPGVDDFMDYRMASFNDNSNKRIWTVVAKFKTHGFFSLSFGSGINVAKYTANSNDNPYPSTKWVENIHDLVTGNYNEYLGVMNRIIPRSTTGSFVEFDKFDKVGYWKKVSLRDNMWNKKIADNTGMAINPNSPPGWWNFPTLITYNVPVPNNPPWSVGTGSYYVTPGNRYLKLEIYLHRLDFILIP